MGHPPDASGRTFNICDSGNSCQEIPDIQFGHYFQDNPDVELVGDQIYIRDDNGDFQLEGTFQQISADDSTGGEHNDFLGNTIIGIFSGGAANGVRGLLGGLASSTARQVAVETGTNAASQGIQYLAELLQNGESLKVQAYIYKLGETPEGQALLRQMYQRVAYALPKMTAQQDQAAFRLFQNILAHIGPFLRGPG